MSAIRVPGQFRIWVSGCSHVGTDLRYGRESLAAAIRQSEEGGAEGGPPFEWDIALHMGGAGKHKEDVWGFCRWLLRPENASRYPEVAGHSVSPVKNGSGPIQKQRQEQYGIDPKAFLLNAEGQIVSGQGMLKYPGWNEVTRELSSKYTQELKANTIGVDEWARTATEIVDRLLVPKK